MCVFHSLIPSKFLYTFYSTTCPTHHFTHLNCPWTTPFFQVHKTAAEAREEEGRRCRADVFQRQHDVLRREWEGNGSIRQVKSLHGPLSFPTNPKTCAYATPCEGQNAFRHWRARRKRDAVAQMYSNGNMTFSEENGKKTAVSGNHFQCTGLSAFQQAQKHAQMPPHVRDRTFFVIGARGGKEMLLRRCIRTATRRSQTRIGRNRQYRASEFNA